MSLRNHSLQGIVVDDIPIIANAHSRDISEHLGANVQVCHSNKEVFNALDEISRKNQVLDFLTTDIIRDDGTGLELIEAIRCFPDNKLFSNGLKLKHIPILVISAVTKNCGHMVQAICAKTLLVRKPSVPREIIEGIVAVMSNYRKDVTQGFIHAGYAIQFRNGVYEFCQAYEVRPNIETPYYRGEIKIAGEVLNRIVLLQNNLTFAKVSLSTFGGMLNDPKTSERDFHEFFLRYPEFLLDECYDILYAEQKLGHMGSGFRADLVAQPRGMREEQDRWNVIELKKHTEKLITDKKYHANFSKSVYNAITQLRNYQSYFDDPRNHESLKKQFHGVVPQPKLTLIIGRTPTDRKPLYHREKRQYPDINIVTYDEVLEFRKIQVSYLESLGLR